MGIKARTHTSGRTLYQKGSFTFVRHYPHYPMEEWDLVTFQTAPQDFWGATLKGSRSTDKIIFLAHPEEHKIDKRLIGAPPHVWNVYGTQSYSGAIRIEK